MNPNPFALARELARPVADGLLTPQEAKAALLVSAIDRERHTKWPTGGGFDLSLFLFRQRLRQERLQRSIAAMHARWEAKRHGR